MCRTPPTGRAHHHRFAGEVLGVVGDFAHQLVSERRPHPAVPVAVNDGAATGDATSAWPGDLVATTPPGAGTLTNYLNILCTKGYLRGGDALKLLTASGAPFSATVTTAGGIDSLSVPTGIGALKVYPVTDADTVSAIFCATHNYVYNTALVSTGQPYGTNGFIVVHKGGDAAIFRAGQAVFANPPWATIPVFQTQVGMLPGDVVGTLGTENPASVYTQP